MKKKTLNPSKGLRRGLIATGLNAGQCCFVSLTSSGAGNSCYLLCLACAAAEKGMFSMPAVTAQGGMEEGVGSEMMAQAH